MKVVGIYLAAGQSKRMGNNKLLLHLKGKHLGTYALETALKSDLNHVLVITKPDDSLLWVPPFFYSEKYRSKWTQIPSKDSNKGMAYSLRCGIEEGILIQANAVMIILADQPFITMGMIHHLIDSFRSGSCHKFWGFRLRNYITPPFLFTEELFPALLKLEGDTGARGLIKGGNLQKGFLCELENKFHCFDVDTIEDYQFIIHHLQNFIAPK